MSSAADASGARRAWRAEALQAFEALGEDAGNAVEKILLRRAVGGLRGRLGDRDGEVKEYEEGLRLPDAAGAPVELFRWCFPFPPFEVRELCFTFSLFVLLSLPERLISDLR